VAQLLALARDGHRIEMIDLASESRKVILTETGLHPDGIVCDGSTIYWTNMGRHTGANAYGEAIYDDVDGGFMPLMLTAPIDETSSPAVVSRRVNS
jgi:hypothetical protein